jgi:hypothetical protein
MKKILLLLLSTIILAKPAFSQIDWGKYSQSYPNGAQENPSQIGIYTAIIKENDSFWPLLIPLKHNFFYTVSIKTMRQIMSTGFWRTKTKLKYRGAPLQGLLIPP